MITHLFLASISTKNVIFHFVGIKFGPTLWTKIDNFTLFVVGYLSNFLDKKFMLFLVLFSEKIVKGLIKKYSLCEFCSKTTHICPNWTKFQPKCYPFDLIFSQKNKTYTSEYKNIKQSNIYEVPCFPDLYFHKKCDFSLCRH